MTFSFANEVQPVACPNCNAAKFSALRRSVENEFYCTICTCVWFFDFVSKEAKILFRSTNQNKGDLLNSAKHSS